MHVPLIHVVQKILYIYRCIMQIYRGTYIMYIKYCSFIALHMHNQLMLSLQKKQTQFTFKNQIIQRQKQTNKHYYTFKTCQEVYRKSQLAVSYCMLHFFGGVCVTHPFSFLSCVFFILFCHSSSCVLCAQYCQCLLISRLGFSNVYIEHLKIFYSQMSSPQTLKFSLHIFYLVCVLVMYNQWLHGHGFVQPQVPH